MVAKVITEEVWLLSHANLFDVGSISVKPIFYDVMVLDQERL